MDNFDEYRKLGEPDKSEKAAIWETAIGLQQVDGLTPSPYLFETAKANIDGDITIDEVKTRLENYYKTEHKQIEDRTEEADKVSANIAEILGEKTFNLSIAEYTTIHKRLFGGIEKHAGNIRGYNVTKKEWVLDGDTVSYAGAIGIKSMLEEVFGDEKNFSFRGLDKKQTVEHISIFISKVWEIHPFCEGNTRTTAVFVIKYLRKFGFRINNQPFMKNSWYFRNALVRAVYEDNNRGVYPTYKFLYMFFENLLFNGNHLLKNRELHINFTVSPDTVSDTVNDTVKLIEKNNNITADEIAKELKISIATVKRHIKKLKDTGKIERIGSDKAGSWKVIK